MYNHSRQAGFNIIGALIGLAIAGIVAVGLSTVLKNASSSRAKIDLDIERQQIATTMQQQLSCANTLSHGVDPTACDPSDGPQEVYDRGNRLIISKNNASPTKMGRLTVRAMCQRNAATNTYGLDIQVARPKPSASNKLTSTNDADFASDPLTGWPASWAGGTPPPGRTSSASLFPSTALPCRGEFSNPAPLPPGTVTTPGGKCVIITKTFSNDPARSDNVPLDVDPQITQCVAGWRQLNVNCPAEYPGALGVAIEPSGNSQTWKTNYVISAGNKSVGGRCSDVMHSDSAFCDTRTWAADGHVAACTVTCCDL